MSEYYPEPPRSRSRLWWIVTGFTCMAIIAAPFLARVLWIASVPAVSEPFDVTAAGHVKVAEGENAFDLYRQATPAVGNRTAPANEAFNRLIEDPAPASIPDEVILYVDSQRLVLELFLLGSERPEALYYQPRDYQVTTLLPVTQELRQMARLANVEALRLELAGEAGGAWKWHRATLRASRHSGMHGCIIERLVGCAIYGIASEGVVRWSARVETDAAMLRTALDDVRAANRMTVPISRPLQVEYLSMQKTIANPAMRSQVIDTPAMGDSRFAFEALCLLTEPEVSQRATRLAFANWLSQCDLPRRERAPTIGLELFDVAVEGESKGTTVSAAEIQKFVQSAPIARLIVPAVGSIMHSHDRDVARQTLLETDLALQIWHRGHGEFPESLEALVGSVLETLPIDPFGKGEPIRYRREADAASAKIWSIGEDGIDNDGVADPSSSNRREGDVVISVKAPVKREEATSSP